MTKVGSTRLTPTPDYHHSCMLADPTNVLPEKQQKVRRSLVSGILSVSIGGYLSSAIQSRAVNH